MTDMFHTTEKIGARIAALADFRYRHTSPITGWQVQEDLSKQQKYPPTSWVDSRPFKIGDTWTGRDYYLWIQTQLTIAPEDDRILLLDFGNADEGFESLLFINGVPYQGVDSNHREVKVSPVYRGKPLTLSLKLWSGLEGGGPKRQRTHRFNLAALTAIDTAADDLLYTSETALETCQQLADDQPVKFQLLTALNNAFNRLDWTTPGDEAFYASVADADADLQQAIAATKKEPAYSVSVIGHTHIDVAWTWRVKHTREKAARSFATVLRYMEQFPEYIFLQSSPQIYQFIKEDYPELYAQIKQRIKEGRWEADGAMWLEADCNIPSGESLTRQIIHGTKFFKQEFDQEVRFLWLPDVFGYSWALPQILKLCGISTFMTTKISWNEYNQMPHDTFWWRGIDGTEILTHFITTPVVDKNRDDWAKPWYHTYTGGLNPEVVLGTYRNYKDKAINSNMLVAYGLGDGGGGVTREMLENRRRLDQMPGLPSVKPELARDYFTRLQHTVRHTKEYVATWDGELYLEYHRGTYTSQGQIKRWNRKTEMALRDLEILYSLTAINGGNYPADEIYKLWETLLRNQFHDIIPGSAIDEVYADSNHEFRTLWHQLDQFGTELGADSAAFSSAYQPDNQVPKVTRALPDRIKSTNQWQIVNTAGWSTDLLVAIPTDQALNVVDASGKHIPSVTVADQTWVWLQNCAPFATNKLTLSVNKDSNPGDLRTATVGDHELQTNHYKLRWNDQGQLINLYDIDNQRQVLKGIGNTLEVFEDKPIDYDAWNIDLFYQQKNQTIPLIFKGVKTNNELFVDLAFSGTWHQSTIRQTVRLYQTSRRIDFITDVDWHQHQELLKTSFDVNIRSTEARFDIQYGNVTRPTHWNTSWDMAKFETVGHQWADLSQEDYGVALLNDSKYGYDIKNHTMRLSLIKSGVHPDPDADNGLHHFTYSLYPHNGNFVTGKVVQAGWALNEKPLILKAQQDFQAPFTLESGAALAIDAFKEAEDHHGWILRIHDFTGGNVKSTIKLAPEFAWQVVDLLERPLSTPVQSNIPVKLKPYQIMSYRITRLSTKGGQVNGTPN